MTRRNGLQATVRRYCVGLLSGESAIVHRDAAREFIAEHAELIDTEMRSIVERFVVEAMKEQSQLASDPLAQGVLFDLPAAITTAPGVTKPLHACTWADLQAGRGLKVDNIDNAQAALDRYDSELRRLAPVMSERPGLTVFEAAAELQRRRESA